MDRILIVDDEEIVVQTVARMLRKAGYEVLTAANIASATGLVAGEDISVVLADVNLDGESGLNLAALLSQAHPDVAVVMVSGLDDPRVADVALGQGAYGYIIKPVRRNELLIAVHNALLRRRLEVENRRYRERLEHEVALRTGELTRTIADLHRAGEALHDSYAETVARLATAAECRDTTTGLHLVRMSEYTGLLMRRLGASEERVALVRIAAQMHDIGKIGIPDSVLLAPGRFTPEQRRVMQQHPVIGYRILADSDAELLKVAAAVALSHHEHWDGGGYPYGIAGTAIPLEGRAAAVADVFDALTSERPYKDAWPTERAVAYLVDQRGRQFDPDMVEEFVAALDDVERIRVHALGDRPLEFVA